MHRYIRISIHSIIPIAGSPLPGNPNVVLNDDSVEQEEVGFGMSI